MISYGYTPIRNISYGTQPIYCVHYGTTMIYPDCGGFISNYPGTGYGFFKVTLKNYYTGISYDYYSLRDSFIGIHHNSGIFTQSTYQSDTSPLTYSLYRYTKEIDTFINVTSIYNLTNSTSSNITLTVTCILGFDNDYIKCYLNDTLKTSTTITIPANTTNDYVVNLTSAYTIGNSYIYPPLINYGYDGSSHNWPSGLVCNKTMYSLTPKVI